jgi:hypothetical protein
MLEGVELRIEYPEHAAYQEEMTFPQNFREL